MFSIDGKKVLLTGATGGIGSALLDGLLSCGAVVCAVGRNREKLEELSNLDRVVALHFDLTDCGNLERLVNEAYDKMGGLDCLICNAGIVDDKLSFRVNLDDWRKIMSVNLDSVFLLNKAVCRKLMSRGGGSVVNISSVVAFCGNVGQASYCASKAGLVGMSKAMAREFAAKNIRINCVAPGYVDTRMTANIADRFKDKLLSDIPMGRVGGPQEIFGPVAFLLSDASSYVTGAVIHVNGGLYMA